MRINFRFIRKGHIKKESITEKDTTSQILVIIPSAASSHLINKPAFESQSKHPLKNPRFTQPREERPRPKPVDHHHHHHHHHRRYVDIARVYICQERGFLAVWDPLSIHTYPPPPPPRPASRG